jgi:hypothetical protein
VQVSESDEADSKKGGIAEVFRDRAPGLWSDSHNACVASKLARLHVDAAHNDEIYLKEWLIRS